MIDIIDVQSAWISRLKSLTSITSLLANADEVREDSWKGDVFLYPNIRVKVIEILPNINAQCWDESSTILKIFSEEKTSREADLIAGVVAEYLHKRSFSQNSIKFWSSVVERLVGADPIGDTVWKAEVHLRNLMSK